MANKVMGEHRCTLVWHSDDSLTSRVDLKVVFGIISQLDMEFGKEGAWSLHSRTMYEHQGMTFDYLSKRKVKH